MSNIPQNVQPPIKVEIVKGPLWSRALKNPFRYYGRMMGFTFCTVFATNTFTTLLVPEGREAVSWHPEITTMALVTKSCYYGVLWPAFYFNLIFHPKNVLILGGSLA